MKFPKRRLGIKANTEGRPPAKTGQKSAHSQTRHQRKPQHQKYTKPQRRLEYLPSILGTVHSNIEYEGKLEHDDDAERNLMEAEEQGRGGVKG